MRPNVRFFPLIVPANSSDRIGVDMILFCASVHLLQNEALDLGKAYENPEGTDRMGTL